MTFYIPIPFGPSPPISPLHYQTGVDLSEYLENSQYYTNSHSLKNFFDIYYNLFINWNYPDQRLLGPIYPLILLLLDYRPSNTVPLSMVIFIIEALCYTAWCYIGKNQLSGIFGIVFALMPHTIWFGILISSDIFSYAFATLFFLALSDKKNNVLIIPIICLALILSRPTGIIFCIGALFLKEDYFQNISRVYLFKFFIIIISIISIGLYLPYFLMELVIIENSDELSNISQHGFSPIKLLEKFFHMFGFHKSMSEIFIAEIVRFFYGILFIIGFFSIIRNKNWYSISLILLICFILFLHVPSWRYLLPFLPVLLLNSRIYLTKLFNQL